MIGIAITKPTAICPKFAGTSARATASGIPNANCSYKKYPVTIADPPAKTAMVAEVAVFFMRFCSLMNKKPVIAPSVAFMINVPGANSPKPRYASDRAAPTPPAKAPMIGPKSSAEM